MTADRALLITAKHQVELQSAPRPTDPLAPEELSGRTLFTLISAGTEVAGMYSVERDKPTGVGYTAVFEIEQTGTAVTDLKPGDRVFTMGPHRSWQRARRADVLPLPAGLDPAAACFTRMLCVPFTTLVTTTARPPDPVLIMGLGPVGNMAAQLFHLAAYEVLAVDPVADRRQQIAACGIRHTFAAAPLDNPAVAGHVALVVDCSGHEAAVLAGCKLVRKRGEVVLVGVPWAKKTDLSAHDLLHAIFHNYVVLRSGWEWEIPVHAENFRARSILGNLQAGLGWLAEGRIKTGGLYQLRRPADCQAVFQEILQARSPKLVTLFDWTA